MKRNSIIFAIGSLLLLLFVLLLFVFQVRKTEVAVVTTFGKATRPITEPGPYWKWPWPIQKVYKFDQRTHVSEGKFEQVLTSDGYSLLISVYVGWKISQPDLFFPRFAGSTNRAEESLEGIVRNAYSGIVGKHPFSHFISTDEKNLKFGEIEQEMLARVQSDAKGNNYGIDITFLGIRRLGLPESVTKLVFERMESEREVQVSRIKSDGERQASDIRERANYESSKLLTDAEAQAQKILGEGEKEAARSFEVFKQEPNLAIFLLKLKALEQFLQNRTTLILDQNTSPLDLLKNQQTAPANP
jgi:modulator of FtsH protease HflC